MQSTACRDHRHGVPCLPLDGGTAVCDGAGEHPPRPVRRELDPARLDALHFPLTLAIPRRTGVPAATSILDLQHELFPQFFSRPERAYRHIAYRAAVRESRLVIAISEHVKETIVERLGVHPSACA